jgi:prevent-host-death family protein
VGIQATLRLGTPRLSARDAVHLAVMETRRTIDFVTRYGHDRLMSAVKIADLKAHLSEHLQTVRRGGHVTVLDRTTPIARIVPITPGPSLTVRPPRRAVRPNRVRLPPPLEIDLDSLALLLDERRDRG